jgi:4-amino-4-deoxy-L-arabinose transferase-like glycosyltransferase
MVVMLSIPWTITTGSLAYNEAGMLFFGTLAFLLALRATAEESFHRYILIGIFLGLAVGCKMTAGVFFAVPVAAIILWRVGLTTVLTRLRRTRYFAGLRPVAITALVAILLYLPWAARAAVYSGGNPAFPLFATTLPRDSWTLEQAERFAKGHVAKDGPRVLGPVEILPRMNAFAQQSFLSSQWSPSWASIYRWAGEKPPEDFWKHIGILWLIVPLAIVLAILGAIQGRGRHALSDFTALAILLVVQILVWMFFTHLQGRFLLPLVIPLSLLIAMGSDGIRAAGLTIGVLRILICVVVAGQALCCAFLLLPEVSLFGGTHARGNRPPRVQEIGHLFERRWNWAAAVEDPAGLRTRTTPVEGKILMVSDARALFLEGTIVYSSTFDINPLGEKLRELGPEKTAQWLRDQNFNYITINWGEVRRLRSTYGFDESITREAIDALIAAGLKPIQLPIDNVTVLQVKPLFNANPPPMRIQ